MFDKIFGDFVVIVDEANIFAGGEFDAMISSCRLFGVFLMDEFDAGIFFSIRFGDLVRIIGRTIIYQNNLEILVSLIDNGI